MSKIGLEKVWLGQAKDVPKTRLMKGQHSLMHCYALLPDVTKALLEPMCTYHQYIAVTFRSFTRYLMSKTVF